MEKRLLVVLYILCFAGIPKTLYGFSQVSTPFIENRGQIQLESGQNSSDVLFYAQLPRATIFVGTSGLTIVTQQTGSTHTGTISFNRKENYYFMNSPLEIQYSVQGISPCQAPIQYCIDGKSVKTQQFQSIVYHNIIPGTELTCSITNGRLCLELIESPSSIGALCNMTFFTLQDIAGMQVDLKDKQHLLFRTNVGTALYPMELHSACTCCNFNLYAPVNNTVRLKLSADGNTKRTVSVQGGPPPSRNMSATIDLSSYLGGSGADSTCSGSHDGNGLILCGTTSSPNFPTSSGTQQSSLNGPRDAFISLFDATGKLKWSTYFGGSGDEIALGCCRANSKIYVVGRTNSSSGLTSSGSMQNSYGGGSSDAFIASFDESTGKLVNCSYFGGGDADEARAVCSLPSGDIAVAGTTLSTDVVMDGQQAANTGASDAFALVLNSNLSTKKWDTYYGGRSFEEGRGIGAMSDGTVVLCGTTSSPNSGAYIAANVGEGSTPPGGLQASGFLVRLDANGKRIWGRYVGGDHYDTLNCLVVAKDFIFLGGHSNSGPSASNNFISSNSAQPSFMGGASDGFVCKINSDGTKVWGSYMGGSGDDRCLSLCVSPSLEVVACGTTTSTDFPLALSDQKSLSGTSDAFVCFFLRDGSSRPVSMLVGGNGDDFANAISMQSDYSVLVGGSTTSSDFKTVNGSQSSYAGAMDAFITRFEQLYVVSVPESSNDIQSLPCFPNPCSSVLHCSLPQVALSSELLSVHVLNELGTCVLQSQLPANTTVDLTTDTLPDGSYTLQISSGMYEFRTRFVKLHN